MQEHAALKAARFGKATTRIDEIMCEIDSGNPASKTCRHRARRAAGTASDVYEPRIPADLQPVSNPKCRFHAADMKFVIGSKNLGCQPVDRMTFLPQRGENALGKPLATVIGFNGVCGNHCESGGSGIFTS